VRSPPDAGATLAQLRLAQQRLVGSSFERPVEAARWLLALQAQDFAGAKWSLGLRTPGSTDADVERALATGEIVRSWPMRGTLHFTAAEDLRWMLALTTPRLLAGAARRRARLDLDERTLERAREVAVRLLHGGKKLTREELLAELERAKISTAGQRGYHMLWHLSQSGTLCFGPPLKQQQTFVLLDEWVKHPLRLQGDEALGELARRYFESHGPATLKDFTAWTKLTAGHVKIALAVARPSLQELVLGGVSYWMARDARPAAPPAVPVLALPGFDEYLLGYRDRSAVLAAEHRQRIAPGANGIFMPTIVVQGQVLGTWRRTASSKGVRVEAVPFTTLSASALKGFELAAGEYGRFLGVAVSVGPKPTPRSRSKALG
jgi:hypothetical protein